MTSRRRRLSSNEGSGLLIGLVLSVITILGFLAFSQSRLTSSVTVEADVMVRGDIAQMLADSAVQEAIAQMRLRANDPDSPIFSHMRELLYAPDLGKLSLSDYVEIPETRALAAEKGFNGYTVDDPEIEVVLQRHFDTTEYERYGVIRYRAAARAPGGMGRKPYRMVEVTQPFKTCLVSSPRPFCLGGVYLANAEDFTDFSALRSLRSRLITANGDLWRTFEELKTCAPADLSSKYGDLERRLIPQETAVERTPEVTGDGESMLIGCFTQESTFYLHTLDLTEHLRRKDLELQRLEQQCRAAAESARTDYGDSTAHDRYIDLATRVTENVEDALFRIWAQRNAFRLVTKDDPFFDKLKLHHHKFEYAYWYRRSQYRVAPREGEKDCNEAFKRFLREHPEPRGIIRVENDRQPLELEGRIPGHFVLLVGAGGVDIKDFNKDDDPEDVVTIVACSGPVRVRGEARCSLFLGTHDEAPAPELDIDEKALLIGNLHMWNMPRKPLSGTLMRLEKYSSGITLDGGRVIIVQTYLHVAIPPKIIYRKVVRS